MKTLSKREFLGTALAAAGVAASGPAFAAKTHTVQMLNKSPDGSERMAFHPPVLRIAQGDSVMFEAKDRGHNSASNDDLLPAGGTAWKGRVGKDIEVTFDAPGVYAYHCTPHQAVGMVGLVLVGNVRAADLDAVLAARHRGKAKARYEKYVAAAKAEIG